MAWFYDDNFEEQFRQMFRMRPKTAKWTLFKISEKGPIKGDYPPEFQLMIFLRLMATGDSYPSISAMFDVPRSTVCNIIHRVLHAVNSIRREVIKLPKSLDEVREVAQGFKKFCKEITFCAGALDGTNIQIEAPDQEYQPRYYIDRRNNYSINTQAICDSGNRFLYAYTGKLLNFYLF